jgi:hypothetical protein
LQSALKSIRFYRVVESADLKPFKILFGLEKPPNLEKTTCFDILIKTPLLCDPEKRKDSLERLQGIPQNW